MEEKQQARNGELQQVKSFSSASALILAVVLTAFFIQHLNPDASQPMSSGFWGVLLLLGGWVIVSLSLRRKLFLILTSYHFAVSVLAFSTVAVMLGTFILQNAPEEEYFRLYGGSLTSVIWSFFLYDLFHSLWFGSLLLLISVSLLLVLTKRNPFRKTQLGFLFSHGGIILILTGALIGFFRGETGMMHLSEGESGTSIQLTRSDAYTGKEKELGFALRLDDFQVDYYKGSYKIYAYRLDGKTGRYRAVGSYKIRKDSRYRIPGSETDLRIVGVVEGEIPSVHVEFRGPDGLHEGMITNRPGTPVYLNEGQIALVIDKREDEVKEYRSLVSVWEKGTEQRREIVQVNHPLEYKGFSFYQSNYDPENLAYSGLRVVRDPGLGIVYAGFVFIGIGVVFIFYIRPRIVEAGRKKHLRESHVS